MRALARRQPELALRLRAVHGHDRSARARSGRCASSRRRPRNVEVFTSATVRGRYGSSEVAQRDVQRLVEIHGDHGRRSLLEDHLVAVASTAAKENLPLRSSLCSGTSRRIAGLDRVGTVEARECSHARPLPCRRLAMRDDLALRAADREAAEHEQHVAVRRVAASTRRRASVRLRVRRCASVCHGIVAPSVACRAASALTFRSSSSR